MKDILKEKFFSIQYFNEEGLRKVSEFTRLNYDLIEYEYSSGNFLIGQGFSGNFYFFCETDRVRKEITFNKFIELSKQIFEDGNK